MNLHKYRLPGIPRLPTKPTKKELEILSNPEKALRDWEITCKACTKKLHDWAILRRSAYNQFMHDALEELNIADHPKGVLLFELCWKKWSQWYDVDGDLADDFDVESVWENLREFAEILT